MPFINYRNKSLYYVYIPIPGVHKVLCTGYIESNLLHVQKKGKKILNPPKRKLKLNTAESELGF